MHSLLYQRRRTSHLSHLQIVNLLEIFRKEMKEWDYEDTAGMMIEDSQRISIPYKDMSMIEEEEGMRGREREGE